MDVSEAEVLLLAVIAARDAAHSGRCFLQISGLCVCIFVVFIGATVVIVVTAADYYFSSMLIQPAGCSFCGPVSTDRPEMDAHCSFVGEKERATPTNAPPPPFFF